MVSALYRVYQNVNKGSYKICEGSQILPSRAHNGLVKHLLILAPAVGSESIKFFQSGFFLFVLLDVLK